MYPVVNHLNCKLDNDSQFSILIYSYKICVSVCKFDQSSSYVYVHFILDVCISIRKYYVEQVPVSTCLIVGCLLLPTVKLNSG